jgi:hypothetical protein
MYQAETELSVGNTSIVRSTLIDEGRATTSIALLRYKGGSVGWTRRQLEVEVIRRFAFGFDRYEANQGWLLNLPFLFITYRKTGI